MKIKVSTPPQTQRRAFLNLLQVSQRTTGALIAKKWPRKRGKPTTPAAQQSVTDFTDACRMIKDQDPEEQAVAQEMTSGRVYMARDIQMAAMYGVLVVISFKNGGVAVGGRTLQASVQAMLDEITDRPGAMLVRSAGGWMSVDAGTLNYVLSSAGPGNVPYWQDIAAVLPTIDELLDGITDTPGTMIYRSGSAWSQIPAGTDGEVLTFDGTGTIPAWATLTIPPSFTFDDRFNVTGTDVALANIASGHVLANTSTVSAEPASSSFAALLDVNLGTAGGRALVDDGTAWVAGTIGQGLTLVGDTMSATNVSTRLYSSGAQVDVSAGGSVSFVLPANTLAVDGQIIRVTAAGTFNGNTHTRQARVNFGASTIITQTNGSTINRWQIDAEIIRLSNTTQRVRMKFQVSANGTTAGSVGNVDTATSAETLSGNVTISVTGSTNVPTANDVVCDFALIELLS